MTKQLQMKRIRTVDVRPGDAFHDWTGQLLTIYSIRPTVIEKLWEDDEPALEFTTHRGSRHTESIADDGLDWMDVLTDRDVADIRD